MIMRKTNSNNKKNFKLQTFSLYILCVKKTARSHFQEQNRGANAWRHKDETTLSSTSSSSSSLCTYRKKEGKPRQTKPHSKKQKLKKQITQITNLSFPFPPKSSTKHTSLSNMNTRNTVPLISSFPPFSHLQNQQHDLSILLASQQCLESLFPQSLLAKPPQAMHHLFDVKKEPTTQTSLYLLQGHSLMATTLFLGRLIVRGCLQLWLLGFRSSFESLTWLNPRSLALLISVSCFLLFWATLLG